MVARWRMNTALLLSASSPFISSRIRSAFARRCCRSADDAGFMHSVAVAVNDFPAQFLPKRAFLRCRLVVEGFAHLWVVDQVKETHIAPEQDELQRERLGPKPGIIAPETQL